MDTELVCAECSRPISPESDYTVIGTTRDGSVQRLLCPQCRTSLQANQLQEIMNPNIFRAFITGMFGAVLAGLIWYYLVTITEFQFGLVSVLMGWLVGKCVVWGSGNQRGRSLQLLSLSLTVIAIIFSEYLILNHYFIEEFGSGYGNLTPGDFLEMYGLYFTEASGFINLLFYGIALWQAYKTPRITHADGVTVNKTTA